MLHQLSAAPVEVATGRSASGKLLFTLQIARFGQEIVVLRTLTIDASAKTEISSWQSVDHSHALEVDPAVCVHEQQQRCIAVAGGGTPVLVDGSTITDQLSFLQITVENGAPVESDRQ